MKMNLKNFLWESAPHVAKKEFEKELRFRGRLSTIEIKEILGE